MGEDLLLFQQNYADESSCIALVYRLKWPSGYRCPRCDHSAAYTITTRRLPLYECRNCKHQASLTAGTVMDKSKTPLHKWLCTMFLVASCKSRTNAVTLAELISVSYKTAWSMLGKIRRAITDMDRDILLSGHVEVKPAIYMLQLYQSLKKEQCERAVIVARSITSFSDFPYYKIKFAASTQEPRELLSREAADAFLAVHVSDNVTKLDINRRPTIGWKDHSPLKITATAAFEWINVTFYGLRPASAQAYLDEFCFRQNTKHLTPIDALKTLLRISLRRYQQTPQNKRIHLKTAL